MILSRQTGKTGIEFYKFIEYLKQEAKTEEEKEYYNNLQEEWSEFCVGITLRSFK